MATTFMNLTLPTVSATLGPKWATEVNAAITTIDSHDHSPGKGTKITPLGLNINAALDLQSNRAKNVNAVQFDDQSASQTGASNALLSYTVSGDLFYTNGSGTAIQITSGGALVATPGAVTSFGRQDVASNLTIIPADTFVVLNIDTTSSRTITLPLASAVANGRIYILQDKTGSANANNITIDAAGSDTINGSASLVIDSNFGATQLVGDGSTNWYII